jgi:hypothetical protein
VSSDAGLGSRAIAYGTADSLLAHASGLGCLCGVDLHVQPVARGVVAEKDPIFLRTRLTKKANLVLAALRLSDSVAKLHHEEAPFSIRADTEIITPVV